MSVETLLNKTYITIDDLHPVEEGRGNSIRQKYEELKESGLYDKSHQWWFEMISTDSSEISIIHKSKDQLIDILLISLLYSKEQAVEKFKEVQERSFDKNKKEWKDNFIKYQDSFLDNLRSASPQLLGVLLTEKFEGKEQAIEEFERVKDNDNFFDIKYGQFIENFSDKDEEFNPRYATVQLLGVLVTERLYGREKARIEYARVQEMFFDLTNKSWIIRTKAQENIPQVVIADTELLDVLVTKRLLGKAEAQKKFIHVKERFFDKRERCWYGLKKNSDPSDLNFIFSQTHLLALWVEKELEEDEELVPERKPLPEIRKY